MAGKRVLKKSDLTPVRVRAIADGIYGGRVRTFGDVFDIESFRVKWEDVEVEDGGELRKVRRIKSKWLELADGPASLPPTEQGERFAHLAKKAVASSHGLASATAAR